MEQNIRNSLESRNSRVQAVIEVCERQITSLYQPALTSLDKMTWDEIEHVKSYLPLLGSNAVDTLCQMLKSSRKQTAEAVTYALGRLGDERAARPLIAMMEEQSGQANALRARDALISLGQVAISACP